MIDEKVHHGLRHLIGDAFADDVEVGGDKATDQLCFEGFPFGEFRGFEGVVG